MNRDELETDWTVHESRSESEPEHRNRFLTIQCLRSVQVHESVVNSGNWKQLWQLEVRVANVGRAWQGRGWQVPAYSMPANRQGLAIQRILVRFFISWSKILQ